MIDPPLDCLCAADLCVDLVLRGDVRPRFHQVEQWVDRYDLELGGSATIFAAQFARLGGRAGIAGCYGQDAFGEFVRRRLATLGIDTTRVLPHPSLPTGLGVALVDGNDRAILTVPGTIDAVAPADLTADLLAACRHWHIASFFLMRQLRAAWPAWLGACRRAGVTTSLDTNWDPDERWAGVLELLPDLDVFLPNETEALALTGETDVRAAGRALASRRRLVAVKRGDQGALAFLGDRVWAQPPAQAPVIVDAIGAGDCFDAGFLRAWQLGRPIEECLAWGARCGEASLGAAGGFNGQLQVTIP